MFRTCLAVSCLALSIAAQKEGAKEPFEAIHVLIVDGQNNHDFVTTTQSLRATLIAARRFRVDVSMSPSRQAARSTWDRWQPNFAAADVIVVNYNGLLWPEHVRVAFEKYVREGGGVVFVHASNNAFPGWKEYNQMIGLGWRNNKFDKRLTIDDATGEQIITPRGEGPGAGHGPRHAFQIKVRRPEHPIMKGIPAKWMHGQDELYHGQRGTAENMTVLSTAHSTKAKRGTGAHEPITWVIPYGKGRCVTTVLGHQGKGQKPRPSLECLGFQIVFARSVEWAATQKVTIPVPKDFPTADQPKLVSPTGKRR